jgi:hypothetical protein
MQRIAANISATRRSIQTSRSRRARTTIDSHPAVLSFSTIIQKIVAKTDPEFLPDHLG